MLRSPSSQRVESRCSRPLSPALCVQVRATTKRIGSKVRRCPIEACQTNLTMRVWDMPFLLHLHSRPSVFCAEPRCGTRCLPFLSSPDILRQAQQEAIRHVRLRLCYCLGRFAPPGSVLASVTKFPTFMYDSSLLTFSGVAWSSAICQLVPEMEGGSPSEILMGINHARAGHQEAPFAHLKGGRRPCWRFTAHLEHRLQRDGSWDNSPTY